MLKRFLLILSLILATICNAQITDKQLYDAYLNGDFAVWKQYIDQTPANNENLPKILNYEYGYIGVCLGKKDETAAKNYLSRAKQHLAKWRELKGNEAMLLMYESAFAAFELSATHSNYAKLGIHSVKYANAAEKVDPANPYVLSLKGNTLFYRPVIAGGSKSEAISYYEKSIAEFEKQQLAQYNWEYLAALLTLAQSYDKTGAHEKALQICQKILRIAPTFKYVRNVYYPDLQQRK